MDESRYASLKIENIVASGVIAHSIDLESVAERIGNCDLNRKRFPGAVLRIEEPKVASLIFSSGKVVLTGLRKKEDVAEAIRVISSSLRGAGAEILPHPEIAITNIVCSYDFGTTINLNRVVMTLDLENIEFEPEQFPGLVYRISDPRIVALLFSSGKIILTGGKTMADVRRALDILAQRIGGII
ncbi:MAG: TATA-box-binding protein [Methanomicrobiaceae archaeon]|nr:TATA-box-binding protein [Methanomicrobiaceae archaeon]